MRRWHKRARWRAAGLLAALPVLAAPAAAGAQGPAPDQRVATRVGETFAVTLDANRSTGYSWALAQPPDPRVVAPAGARYEAPPPGSPPGAGGREVSTFRATGPGETALTLEYRRPFDPPATPPARTYRVAVAVAPAAGLPRTGAGPGVPLLGAALAAAGALVAGGIAARSRHTQAGRSDRR